MKYLISIFSFLLILNSLLFAQEKNFKTVYIAKDVVDNYITAIGGPDKIKKIHTVMLEGQMSTLGMELNMTRYIGKDFYFQILHSNAFTELTAYNDKNNIGWDIKNDIVMDFDAKTREYYKLHSVNFWGICLNGYDLGITYEFNQTENTDTSLYAVDFIKDGMLHERMYFNKHDFHKVKSEINGEVKYYSDFRKVGTCGITMPFLITSNDTLRVSGYQFNQCFNKQLLSKEGLEYYKP